MTEFKIITLIHNWVCGLEFDIELAIVDSTYNWTTHQTHDSWLAHEHHIQNWLGGLYVSIGFKQQDVVYLSDLKPQIKI